MRILAIILLSACACFAQTKQAKSGDIVRLGDKFTTFSATASTVLYTNYSFTSSRSDFTGLAGYMWTNGSTTLTGKSLGRWVISGNSQTHTVSLVRWSDKAVIASGTVVTSGATPGAFAYVDVADFTIAANTAYALVSSETSGGDAFAQKQGGSNAAQMSAGNYGPTCFSLSTAAGLTAETYIERPYVPTNLKYQ